jgi:hypothetical protein
MAVVPHPTYFSLFPRLKIKVKGRHFDWIEVIETESQAVLNNLTEHDFQEKLQNGRSAGNGTYPQKKTTSKVMVACRPKVFDQMTAPFPEIMYGSFYIILYILLSPVVP